MSAIENEEVRVAAIYPLHLLGDPESPPDWLDAVVDGVLDSDLNPILVSFRELGDLNFEDIAVSDKELATSIALRWRLERRVGYLIRVEVANRRYISETTFYGGWGIYRLGWLYLEDLAGLHAAVDTFAEKTHDIARSTFQRKSAETAGV